MLSNFLLWDRILIVCYIIFALFVIVGILYLNIPAMRSAVEKWIIALTVKLEEFNRRMQDDEVFDADWMDYDAWKATRIANRRGRA